MTPPIVTTTAEELHERIGRAHTGFADLVAQVPADLRVGEWTAALVTAHLLTVMNRYTDFHPSRLAEHPRGVDEINRRELDALGDLPVPELVRRLADEMVRFHAMWSPQKGWPLDMALPFHGGTTIALQAALINAMGEFLVHGHDVAASAGRAWSIDDRDGVLLLGFGAELLPAYVRSSNTATALLHFDIDGMDPWVIEVQGPRATARRAAPGDRPDVVTEGPAGAVALLLYHRSDFASAANGGVRVAQTLAPALSSFSELFEEP